MPISIKDISRARRKVSKFKTLSFDGFGLGMNIAVPAYHISKREFSEAVNVIMDDSGEWVTRPPIRKLFSYSTTGNVAIVFCDEINIGGTDRVIIQNNGDDIYVQYGTAYKNLKTLEGRATVLSYNDIAVIMDGSYVKRLSGIYTSNLKMCYDAGTGTTGYQFNNNAGVDNTTMTMYDSTRVAYKFTSQTWDTGYTIPPVGLSAKLSKAGPATGSIYAVVRSVTTDATMAKTELVKAEDIGSVSLAQVYSVEFASGDVTTELSGNVAYYACVEHANGSASAYIVVHCTNGSSLNAYEYTGSAWVANTSLDPIMSLRPGKPPEANFGVVRTKRLYTNDVNYPSRINYSNLTHLDWSTSDGGGYVTAITPGGTGFEVGAFGNLFGDLFIFGQKNHPFMAKLSGSTPSAYSVQSLLATTYTSHLSVINIPNGLWLPSGDGVFSLTGVTEYGDVRLSQVAGNVINAFRDGGFGAYGPNWQAGWSTGTVSGYDSKRKLVLVAFPGSYHRVLCAYIGNATQDQRTGAYKFPWSWLEFYDRDLTSATYKWIASGNGTNEYYLQIAAGGDPSIPLKPETVILDDEKISEGVAGSLADHEWDYNDNDTLGYNTIYFRDDSGDPDTSGVSIKTIVTPYCFGTYNGDVIFGSYDGYLYVVSDLFSDTPQYKDEKNTIEISPRFKSGFVETPFTFIYIAQYQPVIRAPDGGSYRFSLYKNDNLNTAAKTRTHTMYSESSSTQSRQWKDIAMAVRSFMVGVDNVTVNSDKLYIKDIITRFRTQSY